MVSKRSALMNVDAHPKVNKMGRFLFNLSDRKARRAQVKKVRAVLAEREAEALALKETFDPEVGKPTDNPFPEAPELETPVSDSPEAPADEEAAADEETPMPVRKCSVCREPGHTKRDCPTLAAKPPEEGTVSESTGDDRTE